MDLNIKIEGLKELEQNLHELGEEFGGKAAVSALRPAIRKAMDPLKSALDTATPKISGGLAESITLKIGKPTKKMLKSEHIPENAVITGRIGYFWGRPSLWKQALAVELGTYKMTARSPLRNTLDQNYTSMLETFKIEAGKSIEKTAKRLYKKRG